MKNKKKNPSPENQLSPEEMSMLKQSIEGEQVDRSRLPHFDNSDRARLWRGIKKNKIFTAAIALLIVCAVALAAVGIFFIERAISSRPNTDDFTLVIGEDTYTLKYEDAMRGEVLYVDMYKIAEYAGLVRTGSTDRVKFTADERNYLRFENKSDTAVINGALVNLGGVARVNAEVCEVPFDFLLKAFGQSKSGGMSLTLNRDTNTIRINRRMYETDKKDVFEPVEILFHTDGFSIIQAINYAKEEIVYEYAIDVSEYLKYIDPENSEDYLVLANKETPVGEDDAPTDLTTVKCRAKNNDLELRLAAERALYAMMLEMQSEGIKNTLVTSAYRDYAYQKRLFDGYVKKHMDRDGMSEDEAIAAALEYSARPGTSEHQTGLCIDFITTEMGGVLDEDFENYDAYRWLSANAYKYGFILRYPEDKIDVTGYKYEPWHYRFVGRTVATEIYTSGLCLEEYLKLN